MQLLNLSVAELFSLAAATVALVISLYSAVSSRRSADAAERAARSAEEAVALDKDAIRETWVEKISHALPDGKIVESMLTDLPKVLVPEWRQLVTSAARRNPRTPERRIQELFREHSGEWQLAAEKSSKERGRLSA